MKKTALIFILLININIFANESLIWRTAMFSTIFTFYGTNFFETTESGMDLGNYEDVYFARIHLRWKFKNNLANFGKYSLNSYHSFAFAKWQSEIDVTDKGSITVVEYNPIFRIENLNTFSPFLEYSIGTSLISDYEINEHKLGGAFSFNHILGIGYKFNKFNLSLKYQHYSNNGIYKENTGINFYLLSLSYNY